MWTDNVTSARLIWLRKKNLLKNNLIFFKVLWFLTTTHYLRITILIWPISRLVKVWQSWEERHVCQVDISLVQFGHISHYCAKTLLSWTFVMLWEVDLTRVYHVHTKTFHLATPFLCSRPKPEKSEKWRLTVKRAIHCMYRLKHNIKFNGKVDHM